MHAKPHFIQNLTGSCSHGKGSRSRKTRIYLNPVSYHTTRSLPLTAVGAEHQQISPTEIKSH